MTTGEQCGKKALARRPPGTGVSTNGRDKNTGLAHGVQWPTDNPTGPRPVRSLGSVIPLRDLSTGLAPGIAGNPTAPTAALRQPPLVMTSATAPAASAGDGKLPASRHGFRRSCRFQAEMRISRRDADTDRTPRKALPRGQTTTWGADRRHGFSRGGSGRSLARPTRVLPFPKTLRHPGMSHTFPGTTDR